MLIPDSVVAARNHQVLQSISICSHYTIVSAYEDVLLQLLPDRAAKCCPFSYINDHCNAGLD